MACDLEVDRMVSRGTQRRGIWPRTLLVVAGDVVVGPEAPPSRRGILASTSGGHPGAVRRTIVQPGGRKIS